MDILKIIAILIFLAVISLILFIVLSVCQTPNRSSNIIKERTGKNKKEKKNLTKKRKEANL